MTDLGRDLGRDPVPGFAPNKDKRGQTTGDKVLLTAYEVLKEPAGSRSAAAAAAAGVATVAASDDASALQNALNGDAQLKSETPSVKKRHRRMKSSSNKANDLEDCDGYEFQIVSLDNKVRPRPLGSFQDGCLIGFTFFVFVSGVAL